MSRYRLINCEFINSGSFKINISNKAKLLYLMMIMSADDRGFVDTTTDLINTLTDNDKEFDNSVSLELLENTYQSGLEELINRGYVYEFIDNHNNRVYLIRHFFYHNKFMGNLTTNYKKYLKEVELVDNKYIKKTHIKESKIKQYKTSENKLSEDKINENNLNKESEIETENGSSTRMTNLYDIYRKTHGDRDFKSLNVDEVNDFLHWVNEQGEQYA